MGLNVLDKSLPQMSIEGWKTTVVLQTLLRLNSARVAKKELHISEGCWGITLKTSRRFRSKPTNLNSHLKSLFNGPNSRNTTL